jgi:hypothetical protein
MYVSVTKQLTHSQNFFSILSLHCPISNITAGNIILCRGQYVCNDRCAILYLDTAKHTHKHLFIHSVACLKRGPQPLSKPVLPTVRSSISSFSSQYPLFYLRSSSSCWRLLPTHAAISLRFQSSRMWPLGMKATRSFETSATIRPATQRDTFRNSAMHNDTSVRTLKDAGFDPSSYPLVDIPSGLLRTYMTMRMIMIIIII